jgi:mycothiol synthase
MTCSPGCGDRDGGGVTGVADLVRWGPDRAGDLAGLWNRSVPDEPLGVDELTGVCFDNPGLVLATADGDGVVAAGMRTSDLGVATGYLRLVVVDPSRRGQGLGSQLLVAAESWLAGQGATSVVLAGEAPLYLWPGVDATDVATQALVLSADYDPVDSAVNMALPSTFRAPVPDGVAVVRLVDDADVAAVRALVEQHWPQWLAEFDLAVDGASAHGAFAGGDAVGFVAHSVSRVGWLGPMGTDPQRRHGGVGAALVSAVATDVMVAGLPTVEVCWAGPVGFYAKLGATVSRSFRLFIKVL